jgi:hypothetical protein
MHNRSMVILPRKFWEQATDKRHLKQLIGSYLSVAYPGYEVVEVHKYYAICERN